jgi:hypothetical protein
MLREAISCTISYTTADTSFTRTMLFVYTGHAGHGAMIRVEPSTTPLIWAGIAYALHCYYPTARRRTRDHHATLDCFMIGQCILPKVLVVFSPLPAKSTTVIDLPYSAIYAYAFCEICSNSWIRFCSVCQRPHREKQWRQAADGCASASRSKPSLP